MKKCPFCAELIQEDAIKCKHCGEFLNVRPSAPAKPWYFRNSTILITFFIVGPLALPLVWFNPRYSVVKKTIITVISAVLTYFLTLYTIELTKKLLEYYKQLSGNI